MNEDILGGIMFIGLILFLVLAVSIPLLIDSKWNIEKELQLKEMELRYNQNIVLEDK